MAYIGRKLKKRDFRRLWIARINAGARANGMSYSRLINGLANAGVEINRKVLAHLAHREPDVFAKIVDLARENVSK
jgi:large subunit ribosomal protein L20